MRGWHIVAVAAGLGAAWYLYRSTGGGLGNTINSEQTYIPPSTGPAMEAKTGRAHFQVGVPPAMGLTVEAQSGRGHF